MRVLRIAAACEAGSLVVLLVNLLTVHVAEVASFVGPLHGLSYLAVIGATSMASPPAPPGTLGRAFVPGIGGLLVLRRIRTAEEVA